MNIGLGVLAFILVNRILFKDYKADTKAYMKDAGLEDKIESIVPKSAEERMTEEKLAKLSLTEKVELLTQQVKTLQQQFTEVSYKLGNMTAIQEKADGSEN